MLEEIMRTSETIAKANKSRRDKQLRINTTEVSAIWELLNARYRVLTTTNTLLAFARDADLKAALKVGQDFLTKEIATIEKMAIEYGIPTPAKPSANPVSVVDTEVVSDEYIFREIFAGIQSFFPALIGAYTHAITPRTRKVFEKFVIDEMKVYGDLVEFGKLKGWVSSPPAFRV